ncbi:Kup system potassium uptake protein [Cutibacterium acnes JCM 18918]|nr:Kup system potassium uptake protein [Cutibacterium acnes JCM 18918]
MAKATQPIVDREPIRSMKPGLALAALGIVFGDIGTSVLYSLQTVFSMENHAVRPTHGDVMGIISMIFWSILLVVCVKYVIFVMRADNDGEGGILALMAWYVDSWLATRHWHDGAPTRHRWRRPILRRFLYHPSDFRDERCGRPHGSQPGCRKDRPASLGRHPYPLIHRAETGNGGHWQGLRTGNGDLVPHPGGLGHSVDHPPPGHHYGLVSALGNPVFHRASSDGFHCDGRGRLDDYRCRGAIRRHGPRRGSIDPTCLVRPCAPLFAHQLPGQGAMILSHPDWIDNPFFRMAPDWATIPLVTIATMATVIASQAVISGAFSMSSEAARLGLLPRLGVRHTSKSEGGQIYIPEVNWTSLSAC